jgi:hypothetical protein
MMGWFSAVIESRTLRGWAIVAILGAIATAMLLALTRPSFGASDDTAAAQSITLKQLRQATVKYHDVNNAVADGYVAPNGGCVEPPGAGGAMGYHYVNRDDVHNGDLTAGIGGDPLKPEAMLYAPEANGDLKLVAVEWIVRDADQNLLTNDDRPVLFDQPFQGPMLAHPGEGWMQIHYDLHAWIWKDNPNGVFAQYNPDVSCKTPTS